MKRERNASAPPPFAHENGSFFSTFLHKKSVDTHSGHFGVHVSLRIIGGLTSGKIASLKTLLVLSDATIRYLVMYS